ncbi:hypothetical protein WR25_08385 [Diploscapter pachys]|uniref:Uncharacterized protein n=1 Tax=Diploscapter pachys TaxID=2018661 RepID=A0A2A2JP27_9BILA|nr:hypothetical protein WR25_08385 [Diploscapter pachys]
MASTSTSRPDDFRTENDKYLSNLSKEKIEEMQLEIKERLDPKTIQFLLEKRKRTEQSGQSTEPVKISKFKRQKLETQNLEKQVEATKNEPQKLVQFKDDEIPKEEPPSNEVVAEMIKQLEVLDEFGDRTDLEKYNRLATDAYQMDIASKVLRGIVPRQLQNAVKLFDSCKLPLNGKPSSDPIIEMARSKIDEIKLLYLEDIQMENGSIVQTFAKGFNPLVDGAWTLVPIRKVIDAIDARQGQVTSDDVEIVRLALLFTYLLFDERKTAFYAFADPPEIYVRLAEVFVIGSEILEDDVIIHCVHKLTILYLQKAAIEGRLALRMTTKIAGLDAFMPFYEDLLKKYEEYSFGNVLFAKILLIGAYLNSATSDGLELKLAIWSPRRNVARQLTATTDQASDLLQEICKQSCDRVESSEEQYYVQYFQLLSFYAIALKDEKVTKSRNELMFDLASAELNAFIDRHKTGQHEENTEKFNLMRQIVKLTEDILKKINT